MSSLKPHCDESALNSLLDGALSDEQLRVVESHLKDCEGCRARLDGLAADAAGWQEIREQLSDALYDAEASRLPRDCDSGDILQYLAPTDDPHMLGRLGSYEIAGVIGSGGMGIVLKGFERALNRFVAIKVLAPALATSGLARQRFAREARAAAAVVHEHVIAIHSVSEYRGLPYLVMPYLSEPSLARRIERQGALDTLAVLRIGRQVALGLAAAHEQGLVHRDVKPSNILLEGDVERVAITDFGLARAIDDVSITQPGIISGTPQYMSPEQSRGEPVDARSDLFSLGSTIYAMCTGVPPFGGDVSMSVLRRICDEEPRPLRELNPDVPSWLEEIVQRLHRKSPDDRFQSAGEVAELLESWLLHLQQPVQFPAPERLPPPRSPRVWPGRNLAIPFLLCVAIVFGWTVGAGYVFNIGERQEGDANGSSIPQNLAANDRIPQLSEVVTSPVQAVRALCFSPNGGLIAVGRGNQNSMETPGPGSLQVWEVSERKLLADLPEPLGVNNVAFSADNRLVAYSTFEGVVKLIELPRGDEVHRCPAEGGSAMAFSPDGRFLAIATDPHVVELWELNSWKRSDVNFGNPSLSMQLLSIAFSPDSTKVAVGSGVFPPRAISGQAVIWDVTSGERLVEVKANAAVMHVEFSPDGKSLATASLDTRATLWDISTGNAERIYCDPQSGLRRVRFLDQGQTVATLGPRSGISLFAADKTTPRTRKRFDATSLEDISANADGTLLACGGVDGVVRLWDTRGTEPVIELRAEPVE